MPRDRPSKTKRNRPEELSKKKKNVYKTHSRAYNGDLLITHTHSNTRAAINAAMN